MINSETNTLSEALIAYQARMLEITNPDPGKDYGPGCDNDQKLVDAVLAAHRALEPDQVLAITAGLAPKDAYYAEIEGYPGVVHDAPIELAIKLSARIAAGTVKVDETFKPDNLPPSVDMVIPANRYPPDAEALGDNTSRSREALFSSDVSQFLDASPGPHGVPYLHVNPNGFFPRSDIPFHPSTIIDLQIESLPDNTGDSPQVVFRFS